MRIAILLTCHNRKEKTLICLSSLIKNIDSKLEYNIYLVDDASTDKTSEYVKELFPELHLISGSGSLFWAGGMRLAWQTAIKSEFQYDGFLLINDDVEFLPDFWSKILLTNDYCTDKYNVQGLYVLSVKDRLYDKFTYGGHQLKKQLFKHAFQPIYPTGNPQICDLANANILYVSTEIVKEIGILDSVYTHSLADFDYALRAKEAGFPVLVCPGYGGYCTNDHSENLLGTSFSFKQRVRNLYSIKGLALNEYLHYLNKHFWLKAPYAFCVLWLKVLFPKWIK